MCIRDRYTFLQQSFGAVSTIAIGAGGLMGLPLVVSDYRNRKILKRFKVTPVRPVVILLVEVTIYSIYALASLALIYITAFCFFDFRMVGSFAEFLLSFLQMCIRDSHIRIHSRTASLSSALPVLNCLQLPINAPRSPAIINFYSYNISQAVLILKKNIPTNSIKKSPVLPQN